ncbi:hypothetical protein TWF718_005238 [Orbilia javanica]|uniref:Uncharacterized protein n=1 Tax=Orbilia javanica TaxID=47235 RepID=A0AAN8MTX5_9PEZI
MASSRAIDPDAIPVGDPFQYNGPFPCFMKAPYSRRRNAGIPLDVPFHPELLNPKTSDALHRLLSSTVAPTGPIADGTFIQAATPHEKAEIEDWFLPINGQEDNLAGLGGNWDYVKWNAMVVACFMKQIQLGPHLRKLIRVHPPIQLYCEHDDKKVLKAGIMGKQQFQKLYNKKDTKNPEYKPSNGKPIKITRHDWKLPSRGSDAGAEGTPPVDEPEEILVSIDDSTGAKDKGESKGEGESRADIDDDDDDDEEESSDSSDEDTPDWLKINPAPTGTNAVKHPLAHLYGNDPFLPLDSGGNWVPSDPRPKRDITTLVDPDDPLYNVLIKAAQELVDEAKDEKKKKPKKSKKSKKPEGSGSGGSEKEGSKGEESKKSGAGGEEKTGETALRVVKRSRNGSPDTPRTTHARKRKSPSDSAILHQVGAKFGRSALRMADSGTGAAASKTSSPLPPAAEKTKASIDTTIPWERYYSNIGGKGPDFRRRIWPSLKRDLGRKRWHIMPVACDVNGELRWWLMVIDMQVQRRWNIDNDKAKDATKDGGGDATKAPDGTKDASKTGTAAVGPARCIWVFDPCSTPSAPDGTVFERFLSEVPRYIYSLASHELSQLDHRTVPVVFPRSHDDAGLTNLQDGTLPAHEYDHPARFRRFGFKVTIKGNRFNWKNRNPHTGIEVIHAMGRVLYMMELEDARQGAMWRTMGEDSYHLRCSVPSATVPSTAPTLRELDLLQESDETISFQNRVRTETMVEVQRFMDWTQLRGYPFHEETPDTIPKEGYQMISLLHQKHTDVWRQISQWFDQGAHGVVVGINLDDYSTNPKVVQFPLALGTMAVLHGTKGRNPGDDPHPGWWGPSGTGDSDTTGLDLLAVLPDDDMGKINPGFKYRRFAHLKEDYAGGGSMPVGGGPRKPTDILENQYPQSMLSVIIDTTGRGIIHVGNRPNGIWKVNGVAVEQSEVITRFSHVTYLYGSSMHWLFLRRFATSKSENVRMQTTVQHDISQRTRTSKRSKAADAEERSSDDPIWLYPRHTFPDERYKNYKFDLRENTPHFHHHHRPRKIATREEYILWDSYSNTVSTILCQNPACLQHSNYASGGAIQVPNDTTRPCFNAMCVSRKYETYYYGSTTCKNIHGNRCLPDIDGTLGPHIPRIPGHMFIDNGILLFQPEMLVSSSELNINTRGVISRTEKRSAEEGEGAEDDINALPLPPLCWNRIVFTPVGRFPSFAAVREHLLRNYNYEPILLSEGEHSGVAHDMTMYEQLNYYRLLMWNQIQPSDQKGWWREQEHMNSQHGPFTKYDVNRWAEASLKLGYQPDVDSNLVSARDGARDGTSAAADGTIVGTGDPFAWKFSRGTLDDQTLPWDVEAAEGEEEGVRYGYASAAHMFGGYIAPEPSGEETGTRGSRRKRVDGENRADVIKNLEGVSQRQRFNTLGGVGPAENSEGKPTQKKKDDGEKSEAGEDKKSALRTDTTNLRSIVGRKEQPFLHTKGSKDPNPITKNLRTIRDIDGNEITFQPNDMLASKTRTYMYRGGNIEEQYIEIRRKGVEKPIILPVKRIWLDRVDLPEGGPTDDDAQSGINHDSDNDEESGEQNTLDKEPNSRSAEKNMAADLTEGEYDPAVPRDANEAAQESSPEPTQNVPATEKDLSEEETQSEAEIIPTEPQGLMQSVPTTRAEYQNIATKKRRHDDEVAGEMAPAPKKKRGPKPGHRRSQTDPSGLPTESRNVESEVIDESENGEAGATEKTNGRKMKKKLPRMMKEMQ